MPDLPDLSPVTDDDYARVLDHVTSHRAEWQSQLVSGAHALIDHLDEAGYAAFTTGERPDTMVGRRGIEPGAVVVSARLKDSQALVAKMRRFGEPLRVVLDIWGYRVVVASEGALDTVARCCAGLWSTPASAELLLRHGELQFEPWRDYRRRDHAGLSPATTAHYDQAIHLNRRAPFGIAEIQVLTYDLYRRVHCDPASDDSHPTRAHGTSTQEAPSWPPGKPCRRPPHHRTTPGAVVAPASCYCADRCWPPTARTTHLTSTRRSFPRSSLDGA